jgi:hypothetical protein
MRAGFNRRTEIDRMRIKLERTGFPRLKMLLLVALTGGAGFLASYLMLRCCVSSMAIRYPIAIGIAYLVFLLLLWIWLRTTPNDYSDVPDPSVIPSPTSDSPLECPPDPAFDPDPSDALGETLSAAAQADELAIPLLVLLLAGALLFSSLWIVYTAPTLFAEILIDAALSAGLYHRLRRLETRHWLATAVRRTAWSFAITAFVASFSGMALQASHPGARSIGDIVHSHDTAVNPQ